MNISREFFTDIFRLLSGRIRSCGQSAETHRPIDLANAIVTGYASSNIDDYHTVYFEDPTLVPISTSLDPGIDEFVRVVHKGHVMIHVAHRQGETMKFTFADDLDHTIVQYQPTITDQDYIKFKLKYT